MELYYSKSRLQKFDRPLIILNSNENTRNFHIVKAIIDDAKNLLGDKRVLYASYETLVTLAKRNPGAVLIVLDGQRAQRDVLAAARAHLAAMALWAFDDPYNLTENVESAGLFDHVFTNDPASVESYLACKGGKSASHLPLAAPSCLLQLDTIPAAERPFDLFFCGTAWPNRVTLLNRLITDLPKCVSRIFLVYNAQIPAIKLNFEESAFLKSLSFEDTVEMARRTKVTLSLGRKFAGSDPRKRAVEASYPGPRVFEMAAVGAYQLAENSDGLSHAFSDGYAIDQFSSYDALLKKITAALANPNKRDALTKASRKLIADHGTYRHRLMAALPLLIDLCETRRATRSRTIEQSPRPKHRKPRLLFAIHSTLAAQNFGGLELHQDTVAQGIKDRFEIRFLTAQQREDQRFDVLLLDDSYERISAWSLNGRAGEAMLREPTYERIFATILHSERIDLVHFFHFLKCPPSLTDIARALDVPYTVSLHDYFPIMQNFTLSDAEGRYLGDQVFDLSEIDRLLSKTQPRVDRGAAFRRHVVFNRALTGASSIIYLSASQRKIFERAFPSLSRHPNIRKHHAPLPSSNWRIYQARAAPTRKRGPLRYVLLGNLAPHKGGHYLIRAINASDLLVDEFHFHGSIDPEIRKRIEEAVGQTSGATVFFHGRYAPGTLDLTQYDASLHLSTWPETYCQALSEVLAQRVVPIVTDMGALGDRIEHGVNGLKVHPDRPSHLAEVFRQLAVVPGTIDTLQKGIHSGLFMDQADAANQYAEAFHTVIERHSQATRTDIGLSSASLSSQLTTDALGQQQRATHWTFSHAAGDGDEPIRPTLSGIARSVAAPKIKKHFGRKGYIDGILVGDRRLTPKPTVYLNDDLQIYGWIMRQSIPDDPEFPAMIAVSDSSEPERLALFPTHQEPRPDVARVYGEGALAWGFRAPLQLFTDTWLFEGRIKFRLGHFNTAKNRFHSVRSSLSATVIHGNRPREHDDFARQ